MRRPSTPSSSVSVTEGTASGIEVVSHGSWPAMVSRATAASADRRWRTGRSGRGSMRTRPARSGTRVRRSASCRPRRTVRPADGSTRRCRIRTRAERSRPRPPPRCRRSTRPGPGTDRAGLRVGPKAEFSVEEPMANSSRFVLPTMTAPAARSRSTTVASYGGRQPSRIFDEHVVGTPRVQKLSLSATGTPASGPGSSPRSMRRSMASAWARASSARTRLKACSSDSRSSMRARCSSTTSRALRSPSLTACATATAFTNSSLEDRGDLEASVLDVRRRREHFVAIDTRTSFVRPEDVAQRVGMRGRRNVGDIERFDVRGVFEHRRELWREQLELGLGQVEACELGDVQDVVAGDRRHRAVIVRGCRRLASWPFLPRSSRIR